MIRARSALVARAGRPDQRRAALVAGAAPCRGRAAARADRTRQREERARRGRGRVQAARSSSRRTRRSTDGTSVAKHPNVQRAAAQVRDAYLDVARNTLPAPVSGYVAKRAVQLGQRVAPGTPLMAIVPLDQVWVDANFKEVQLRKMRVGQPVTLTADLYGGKVEYHGKVVGLRPAPAARSRCCRRRTRPATGSRSCSACRCASRSTRRSSPSIRCASACRCVAKIDTSNQSGAAARQRASRRAQLPHAGVRARHARRRRADRPHHRGEPRHRQARRRSRVGRRGAAPRLAKAN